MKSEERLAGWICLACESPGRCIVYDKMKVTVDGIGTSCLVKPHGCSYHNNYVHPVWNPLTIDELRSMVK